MASRGICQSVGVCSRKGDQKNGMQNNKVWNMWFVFIESSLDNIVSCRPLPTQRAHSKLALGYVHRGQLRPRVFCRVIHLAVWQNLAVLFTPAHVDLSVEHRYSRQQATVAHGRDPDLPIEKKKLLVPLRRAGWLTSRVWSGLLCRDTIPFDRFDTPITNQSQKSKTKQIGFASITFSIGQS